MTLGNRHAYTIFIDYDVFHSKLWSGVFSLSIEELFSGKYREATILSNLSIEKFPMEIALFLRLVH